MWSSNGYDKTVVEGKFFKTGESKYYIKGATYGTFAPNENGYQFPAIETVKRDFQMMAEAGINTVRTYTVPSQEILNVAFQYNLKIMVGLPWEHHITFLDSNKQKKQIIQRIKQYVEDCKKHPAIFCYTIGNEIPAPIVRWYGDKKVSGFLKNLFNAVKSVDPEVLVTYVNYPTTEYLHLPFLDFDCFNVYLEDKEKLSRYLMRLHNLGNEKPLVLAEIGLDSLRNSEEKQAEVLNWQLRTIFQKGCAGAFVFSWTDAWWRGGEEIMDWDFGLVDRQRQPKPALKTVQNAFNDIPFKYEKDLPRISVVVCSYNGGKTIRDTMEGLKYLDYPDYEIIVINDGSTDNLTDIVSEYDVKLISTENRGLGNARNRGMHEATGGIISYIDDDAYPDPQWLKYIASAFLDSSHAGIGGPNLKPAGDGPIADCVANSPGGPTHVLVNDEIAEHIPGCNMSFRRNVLLDIGGFDPVFRTAGDDVDICWKLQNQGYTIGFHPSAFVWHHCRNSYKMYWKQQKGYGKAEALLEKKWPHKYNIYGHLSWSGRIYGNGLTVPVQFKKKKIFYGQQGTALFQSVYQPANGFFGAVPLMPEWYIWVLFLAVISLLGIEWKPLLWALPLLVASILIVVAQAGISASHAKFNNRPKSFFKKFKYFGLTTYLHIVQPLARLIGRVKHGLTPWRGGLSQIRNFHLIFKSRVVNHWSEKWYSASEWLNYVEKGLEKQHVKAKKGNVYDRWDIQIELGPFASVRALLTIEDHNQGRQYLKLRNRISVSSFGVLLLFTLVFLCYMVIINYALISSVVIGLCFLILGLKILSDICAVLNAIQKSVNSLPDGSETNEMIIPVRNLLWDEQLEAVRFKYDTIHD